MKYKILALLLCVSLLISCSTQSNSDSNENTENSDVELDIKGLSHTDSVVEYDDNDFYTEWENEDPIYIKLTGSTAESDGSGVEINNNIITIGSPGTYVVSGKLENGQIIVDSNSDNSVKLVLNNAEISCSDNAPIYVKNSGKTIISLPGGTENIVADGSSYILAEGDDEPNAAIFSKDDLTVNGTGSLTVNGNYNNGIFGKDVVKITGGTINVTSVDDGLLGRDLLAARDCNIIVNSQGVAIKSTNDTDEDKGNIVLESGSYVITSGAKGIKSESDLTIIDGNYTINSADDSIHSNNSIFISGGVLDISSGDDGIHGDSEINISGGTVNIAKSYEGIESGAINISGGTIQIAASDDGINVAGGKDGSSVNGRAGQNSFAQSESYSLNISGGNIYVDSKGDGLDANGSIFMSGGTVIVNGPVSDENGALDYDQKCEISGGLLITAGSSGMAMAPSENSSQNSVMIRYSQTQKAGTLVNVSDSDGNSIITFAPEKDYASILISSPDLKLNSTYKLYTGGTYSGTESNGLYTGGTYENGTELCAFTVSKSVISISETGDEVQGGMGMPGQGGHRGNGEGMMPGQRRPGGNDENMMPGMNENSEGTRPEMPEGFNKETPPNNSTGNTN